MFKGICHIFGGMVTLVHILIYSDDRNTAGLLTAYTERFFCNNGTKYDIKIIFDTHGDFSCIKRFHIAFVDMDTQGFCGTGLLAKMKQANPSLLPILVADTDQQLDDAIKIGVLGYLSKPPNQARVAKNLDYALREYYSQHHTVIATSDHHTIRIPTEEIVYITTANRKTRVRTVHNDFLCEESLAQWYENLAEQQRFVYSHTSYLVNLEHVVHFDKSEVTVRLGDGTMENIYMSQRKYSAFKAAFLEYSKNAR